MAGEMIYILEQRIKNQKNISEEKVDLVLHDIISQTLKQKYLQEIFNMEKLFDLTLMMTKYQIQSVVTPEQILTITINHLSGMKRIAKQEDDLHELIKNAHAMFLMLYTPVPVTEWYLIRCQILNFFQDCRVRVSILLRDERQLSDGHFSHLPLKEPITLPPDVEVPGLTKYYENGEFVKSTQWPVARNYITLQNPKSPHHRLAILHVNADEKLTFSLFVCITTNNCEEILEENIQATEEMKHFLVSSAFLDIEKKVFLFRKIALVNVLDGTTIEQLIKTSSVGNSKTFG
ncbi:hypothetical protein DICVIV_06587 [Dictyocaulus viviparus]|uniref:Uncharacterized protein n=1 Tax=Dictyocaulus viviparus TaxID=29172 RepID=A0A0D8XRT0_DICVI|nr:hypothetical protein DICVIV_06587 [Dictyocaulus viviparus]